LDLQLPERQGEISKEIAKKFAARFGVRADRYL